MKMIALIITLLFLVAVYLILRSRWIEDITNELLCFYFNANRRYEKEHERNETPSSTITYLEVFYSSDEMFRRIFTTSPGSFIKSHYYFHILRQYAPLSVHILKSYNRLTKRAHLRSIRKTYNKARRTRTSK